MSDQSQDTVLNSVTDNLVESFFEGGASSKNVVVPEDKKEPKLEDKPIGSNFMPATPKVNASDLLGDFLDKEPESKLETPLQANPGPEDKKEPISTGDYNFLIDKGVLAGFEDDSAIKTPEDLEKLIKGNKAHWETEAKVEAIKELEQSLPEEVKFLVNYAKTGGSDLKDIFKILSQTEEIKSHNIEDPNGQKSLVRAYYQTQNWTEDEIEEELVNLVETKRLQTQATKLKPKLEKINQDILEEKQEERKLIEQEQQKARQFFTNNIVDTLKKGKLGDLTLNKQEQEDIYSALVKEKYNSFGNITNRLGALLDKIQYVEPDYELLAEVTMLLTDRDGFKKKLRDQINTDVSADTIKKIKVEQNKAKINSAHSPEKDSKKIPKLSSSFINPFE